MPDLDFAQLRDDLKRDEGWRAHAYQDTLGYWTIGYGFLVDERKGGGLPQHIGDKWLYSLISKTVDELDSRIPWWKNQPEEVQRALVNMAYQLGVNGLLRFNNMLGALRDGRREEAALHALDSRWASQTPNRARRVAALIGGYDENAAD